MIDNREEKPVRTKNLFYILILSFALIIFPVFAQPKLMRGLPDGAIARLGKGGINVIQFSPDGTLLAVGTDVGVRLYNVTTKEEITLPNRIVAQISTIAFSKDGRILACAGYFNPIIQLWDVESRMELPSIPSSKPRTYMHLEHFPIYSRIALTFSEKGNTLIGVDNEGLFTYWDINSQKIESEQQEYSIFRLMVSALSQDGRVFITGSETGEISLWDTQTGNRDAIIKGHKPLFKSSKRDPSIRTLAFSPDGKTYASGSKDMTVRIWDTERRKRKATLKGHKAWVTAIAFSHNGEYVTSGDSNGEIRIWDTRRKRLKTKLDGHTNSIITLAFSPDGKTYASGSADGTIKLWDTNTWKEPVTLDTDYTEWVRSVAFSPDNTTVSTAMYNNTVQKYDVHTGDLLSNFTTANQKTTYAVALSPDATLLACHPVQGNVVFNTKQKWQTEYKYQGHEKIQLWDMVTGKELPTIMHAFGRMLFTPDSNYISCSSSEGVKYWVAWNRSGTYTHGSGDGIYLWNVRTGDKIYHLQQTDLYESKPMAMSPDGVKLVTPGKKSWHGPLIWNVEKTDKPLKLPKGAEAAAFSPDGAILATIYSFDIHLWDTETGEVLRKIRPTQQNAVQGTSITFSPEGSMLLVSKVEPVMSFPSDFIEIIDVVSGKTLRSLPGHTEPIETLVFSHDGKILASGSEDGTVLLWDWKEILAKIKPDDR